MFRGEAATNASECAARALMLRTEANRFTSQCQAREVNGVADRFNDSPDVPGTATHRPERTDAQWLPIASACSDVLLARTEVGRSRLS